MIVKDNVPIQQLVKRIFRKTYGVEDNELYRDVGLRERIRNAVKSLRASYAKSFCDTDYSDKEIRKAYMISYYPYYIEPARYVMSNFVVPARYDLQLQLNFFACGPCPELYGALLALHDKACANRLSVKTYDAKFEWIYHQRMMTADLCKEILPIENWTFRENFFVGDSTDFYRTIIPFDPRKIFFLQNYLSHMPDTPEAVEKFLKWFLVLSRVHMLDIPIFVFIDLNYNSTATVFRRLTDESFLEANHLYKIAAHIPDDGEPLTIRHGDTTQSLRDNIFTDTFESGGGLVQKKRTNFYYVFLEVDTPF